MKTQRLAAVFFAAALAACASTQAPHGDSASMSKDGGTCGPQAPRDISIAGGKNTVAVPTGDTPNLCNVHFHSPFEHAGFDDFHTPANDGAAPVCGSVNAGDKVEFHWVHTNCGLSAEAKPGLANCVCDRADLTLRVITQAYVVDSGGVDLAMPSGSMVEYVGSTTGPKYTDKVCSQAKVNWAVNKKVKTLRRDSLAQFCAGNTWSESKPHGIREVVTRQDWLAPFQP